MKKCFNQQETYCASPCDKFMPIMGGAHNRFNTYDECTLVYDEETLVAYLSKKCVHRGVEITNREYWQPMNVSGYADDNIIIFSDRNLAGLLKSYTLETAVPCVSIAGRKNGAIISFYNSEGIPHWELWLYWNTDTVHWEELQYWKSIINIYNKFLGWFDSLEQLDTVPINNREGKYALVGNTLINAHIFKGSKTGWIDTGINIYQKFFDDLCSGGVELTDALKKFFLDLIGALDKDKLVIELTNIFDNIEEFPDVLDALRGLIAKILKWLLDNLDIYPDLKDILEKYLKDLIDLYGKNEVTDFEVISDIEDGIANMSIIYPTSPYYDLSKMFTYNNEYGRKNESVILVPFEMTKNLHLKFTAGVWKDITNNGEPLQTGGCSYGSLRFDIPEYEGLQVRLDGGIVNPYNPEFNVFCDGLSHTIEFLGGTTFRTVTFHYYRAIGSYVGKEYTKEVKVAVGNKVNPENVFVDDVVIASVANNYQGHTFYNWSESKKIYNTTGLNPYTDMNAVHSYCVLGKGDVTPYYFNFDTPITEDIDLYAWYKIPVDLYYESPEGPSTTNMFFNYGDKYTPPYNIAALEGKEFAGWRYNGKVYAPREVITITIDGVIVAEWKDSVYYTVTFDANGGSPTPDPLIIREGGTVEEPTPPTKLDNKFNGWKNNTIPFDFNTKITKDITLTASWVLNLNACELSVDTESLNFSSDNKTITFNIISSKPGTIINNSTTKKEIKTVTEEVDGGTSDGVVCTGVSEHLELLSAYGDTWYRSYAEATCTITDDELIGKEGSINFKIDLDIDDYKYDEATDTVTYVGSRTTTRPLGSSGNITFARNVTFTFTSGSDNALDPSDEEDLKKWVKNGHNHEASSYRISGIHDVYCYVNSIVETKEVEVDVPLVSLSSNTFKKSSTSIKATINVLQNVSDYGYILLRNECGESINLKINYNNSVDCQLNTSIDKIAFDGDNKILKFNINSTSAGTIDTSNIYWEEDEYGRRPSINVTPRAFGIGLTEITVKLNSGFDDVDDLGSILLTNDCGTKKVLAIGHKKYPIRVHYQWIGEDDHRPNGSEVQMFFGVLKDPNKAPTNGNFWYPGPLRFFLNEPVEGQPYMYPRYFPEGSSLVILDHIIDDWMIRSDYKGLWMSFTKIGKYDINHEEPELLEYSPVGDVYYSIGNDLNYTKCENVLIAIADIPDKDEERIKLPELSEGSILDIYVKVVPEGETPNN